MRVRPNKTIVRGRVCAIHPEPDGGGAEEEIEVMGNESPRPDDDFLRPQDGSILKAFCSDPNQVRVGELVRATAHLNASPRVGRAVLQEVEPVKN